MVITPRPLVRTAPEAPARGSPSVAETTSVSRQYSDQAGITIHARGTHADAWFADPPLARVSGLSDFASVRYCNEARSARRSTKLREHTARSRPPREYPGAIDVRATLVASRRQRDRHCGEAYPEAHESDAHSAGAQSAQLELRLWSRVLVPPHRARPSRQVVVCAMTAAWMRR
jgi:hypothetical protein